MALLCVFDTVSGAQAQTDNDCARLRELDQQTLRDFDYQGIAALAEKLRQSAADLNGLMDEVTRCKDQNSDLLGSLLDNCSAEINAYNRAAQSFKLLDEKIKTRQQLIQGQLLVNRSLHPCG
jgi:hypothetical protein